MTHYRKLAPSCRHHLDRRTSLSSRFGHGSSTIRVRLPHISNENHAPIAPYLHRSHSANGRHLSARHDRSGAVAFSKASQWFAHYRVGQIGRLGFDRAEVRESEIFLAATIRR